MIVAVVGMVYDQAMLPYYLRHYRDLGVERFVIACDPRALDPSGGLQKMLHAQPDVEIVELPRTFRRSSLVGMIEEEVRSRVATAGDWAIPADLDELNQYPGDLHEVVGDMERDGSTHMLGELVDRLAPGGVLAELEPFGEGISIWKQYPLEAHVTDRIGRGETGKVLLSRGDLGWRLGHHRMRESPELKRFAEAGVAHHFKWRRGIRDTLRWRVRNEEPAGMPWSVESERLDRYLQERERILLADVEARFGWRPEPTSGPSRGAP